ncbi:MULTISPECIES: DUF2550 domain-containing protein [unclassified Corynebacterium]|uniref:DUF2550 domain-containing protein n=1 Tax=unclassified Corynebacterium TaxID=2624378 RepID=UPI0029CA4BD4|nr:MULTISPECIES: DUF2550 domain-containing protein [unclassified Corynebacterium]WPF67018.1 DUF2550 domain-containing protein [Corynebacterium sp. 22KM0430]WPF69506.1 DUF2550 domain-containing protein [Corynebacterium sp. 21KM1197]
MGDIAVWLVVALVGIVLALAAWRFFGLRSRGTTVVLRPLPASGTHGWRHGLVRYEGEELRYYKLRSLAPVADVIFDRQALHLASHRDMSAREASFMAEGSRIVVMEHGNEQWEVAVDMRTEMALRAWLESAPDVRQERPNYRVLKRRITHLRRR